MTEGLTDFLDPPRISVMGNRDGWLAWAKRDVRWDDPDLGALVVELQAEAWSDEGISDAIVKAFVRLREMRARLTDEFTVGDG